VTTTRRAACGGRSPKWSTKLLSCLQAPPCSQGGEYSCGHRMCTDGAAGCLKRIRGLQRNAGFPFGLAHVALSLPAAQLAGAKKKLGCAPLETTSTQRLPPISGHSTHRRLLQPSGTPFDSPGIRTFGEEGRPSRILRQQVADNMSWIPPSSAGLYDPRSE
jgi:hypothetical protein